MRPLRLSLPRSVRRGLLLAQTFVLALSTMFATPSFAIEIQLSQTLQLQTLSDSQGGLETTEVLAAGSIVDVPPEYRINDARGNFDSALTLNNWLRNAGQTGIKAPDHAGGLLAHGAGFNDYFYPVRIVSAAPGSRLKTYQGRSYFLALRQLVQQQGQLATRVDAPVIPADSVLDANEGDLQSAANCPNGSCKASRTTSPQFDRLVQDLTPVLHRVTARELSNQARTGGDFEHLEARFQASCGFSLNSFIPVVKQYASTYGIPSDIALSIMVQESSGRCYARGTNGDLTSDSGLFGVNSGTAANVPTCSTSEINALYRTPARALASGPQCRENPVINLQLGLQILKNKMENMVRNSHHNGDRLNGFDRSRLVDLQGHFTRTAWRLAVSAYNGGEKWVLLAKHDLEDFNKTNGTKLDPYNWEDLRIFYLRQALTDSREEHYFGETDDGRDANKSIANLSYTENIVPTRSTGSNGRATVAELWRDYEH